MKDFENLLLAGTTTWNLRKKCGGYLVWDDRGNMKILLKDGRITCTHLEKVVENSPIMCWGALIDSCNELKIQGDRVYMVLWGGVEQN